jgi:coproporphyrinogen III oxidase-like Fe-S oxidoreductase
MADMADVYEPVSAWCFGRKRGMTDEYIVVHDEYAGVGSGAFGYVNGVLYANSFDVGEYMAAVGRSEFPVVATVNFPGRARMGYDMLMQLFGGRLDLSAMRAKYGKNPSWSLWKELLLLRLTGAVVRLNGSFRLTSRGQQYLVVLMSEFFAGVAGLRESLLGGKAPAGARTM